MDISIVKSFFINISIVYSFCKIINYIPKTTSNKIIIVLVTVAFIIVDLFFKFYYGYIINIVVNILFQAIILSFITKTNFLNSVIGLIISNSISYIILVIVVSLVYIFSLNSPNENKFASGVVTFLTQNFLVFRLFKLKRFKDGIYFLQKRNSNDYLILIISNICAFLILIYCIIVAYPDITYSKMNRVVFVLFFIMCIFEILVIKKTLTISYKNKLIEQTLKEYEAQIKEKDEQLKKLDDEKYKISKLNHEFYNRQKALMLKVEDALANMNYEAGEDNNLKEKIQELSNEYTNKALENRVASNLTKTGVEEIDDMFTYMHMECKKCGIEFVLQISGNINFLINNYIEKSKLVTLIGDHLRDAIIAVNYSKNQYKSILAILGIKDDNYEFCIYDSGIEFEIETLDKIGIEPATTHKEDGGSGIGFMTTFETLKEIDASFVLEELNSGTENSYTKAVKFIFDKKSRLEIVSYRAENLKNKFNSNRFVIKLLRGD